MKALHYISVVGIVCCSIVLALASCSGDDIKPDYNPIIDDPTEEEPQPEQPTDGLYTEAFRPQVHYTPAKNWVNDPNGMVYIDGTWHLFYQYNPMGNDWGNMSWGHATSTDLFHWKEQPVALTRDELGAIFSGSCVIDKQNTAGFGAGAMIVLYTSAGETGDVAGKQQQSIAYSTDGGNNFTRYASNPVIKNDDDNLRDPKVFWHEASKRWIMALAKGWKRGIEFYGSADLKAWQHLSTFVVDLPGRPNLQWECPDLIQVDGRWVLIVSVNPGGPIIGSGTMYFIGNFDGTTFTADERDYPLWLDYGTDNYAGVTWSNTGDRRLFIGWMNNWQYSGAVPCSPWRSTFTLPRELHLAQVDGKPILCAPVAKEIEAIAGQWQDATLGAAFPAEAKAYHAQLTFDATHNASIALSNPQGETFTVDYYASERLLVTHRTAQSGRTDFNSTFAIPSMRAPLNNEGNTATLDFYIDQSSVELLTAGGATSQTTLVFPSSVYNAIQVSGTTASLRVRTLQSIWGK